jgi:general secretion pathway protein J
MSSKQRGLTLVEVMVALLILSIISILSWRALDSMTRSREALDLQGQRFDQLQAYFRQWDQDCRELGTPDQWLVVPPAHLGSHQVNLIRQGEKGWSVVSWVVENGQLQRLETPPIKTRARLREIWAEMQNDHSLLGVEPQALKSQALAATALKGEALVDGRDWSQTDEGIQSGATSSDPHFLSGLRLTLTLPGETFPRVRICQTGLN